MPTIIYLTEDVRSKEEIMEAIEQGRYTIYIQSPEYTKYTKIKPETIGKQLDKLSPITRYRRFLKELSRQVGLPIERMRDAVQILPKVTEFITDGTLADKLSISPYFRNKVHRDEIQKALDVAYNELLNKLRVMLRGW
jgi:hypothetical protein